MISDTLPKTTRVNRVIPKKAFYEGASPQLRRQFTEQVEKIRWTHKLAPTTLNLPGIAIPEIQCFDLHLRTPHDPRRLIRWINESVPYPIVLTSRHEQEYQVWLAVKHEHPQKPDRAVIDWMIASDNYPLQEASIAINLEQSLDFVYADLCYRVAGLQYRDAPDLAKLVDHLHTRDELIRKEARLKGALAAEKQFKKRVEINLALQKVSEAVQQISSVHRL